MILYYTILEKHSLLLLKWTSEWSVSGYINNLDYFISLMKEYRFNFVISDMRDLKGNIKISELKTLMQNKPDVGDHSYRTVYLIDHPEYTAFIHLYSEKFNKGESLYQYCITADKAASLLSLQISGKEIEQHLVRKKNVLFSDEGNT